MIIHYQQRTILETLGEFDWITTLDLENSFHQIPIATEDQQKTAFTFLGERWMFCVVPFGLKTASPFFQKIMEQVLAPLHLSPLQNDVPIADKGTNKHIARVKQALEQLTNVAGLRLRMKKCKFFRTEAKILGTLVTRHNIKMDPA